METRYEQIYKEVDGEIVYQQNKWGVDGDDKKNTPWHWASYIGQYATKWMTGTWTPLTTVTVDQYRKGMIKVAALAVSAVASLDRQRDKNLSKRAFFEEGFSAERNAS